MPRTFFAAQVTVTAMLLALSSALVWRTVTTQDLPDYPFRATFSCALTGIALAAIVGIWRRLVWGRVLSSCIVVFASFTIAALLLPDIDDPDPSVIELWFGRLPPIWLHVSIVIGISTIMLLPLVALGWHRENFRCSRW